jgi:hypothetical protein
MPSLASRLQMRLAARQSFPRVKPWANAPTPDCCSVWKVDQARERWSARARE